VLHQRCYRLPSRWSVYSGAWTVGLLTTARAVMLVRRPNSQGVLGGRHGVCSLQSTAMTRFCRLLSSVCVCSADKPLPCSLNASECQGHVAHNGRVLVLRQCLITVVEAEIERLEAVVGRLLKAAVQDASGHGQRQSVTATATAPAVHQRLAQVMQVAATTTQTWCMVVVVTRSRQSMMAARHRWLHPQQRRHQRH
jgi:hypothetical protein